MSSALKKGCYRLLIQNKDKLFLFYPIKDMPYAKVAIWVIPEDDIERLTVLPNYDSCGGEP
jgi:hypothetical protein